MVGGGSVFDNETFHRRLGALAFAAILLTLLTIWMIELKGIFQPFFIALGIYFVLKPGSDYLSKNGFPIGLSYLTMLLSTFLVIIASGYLAFDQVSDLADDEEQIKWAISEALIEFKNPQCLLPLVDLLMCDEDFGLRWRSLEALRNITRQEFGYYAAGNAAERKVPANKWKQWVEQNMKNANLKFDDSSVNNLISLFNGNDLSTWDELPLDGFNVNAVNDGWDVKDQTILTNVGKRSVLVTKRSFLNYEFNFEYKMFDRNSDSGIGIFLDEEKKNYLEIQIYPNRSGDIYRIGRAEIKLDDGNALGFSSKKFKNSNELDGQWNKMTIRVNNGQAEILINGEIQNRAFSELKKPTRILLRNEGSRVAFKNLILKNL